MINVRITDADEFWQEVTAKQLADKFGVRVVPPKQQPYGKEVVL